MWRRAARGAPGAHLAWSDHPGDTITHFPQGACSCGADLKDARDLGVTDSHQIADLPEATAQTIWHGRHQAECSCGRRHVADAPPEAADAVTYGLNGQAWRVFLMVMHHVPVERDLASFKDFIYSDPQLPPAETRRLRQLG
jgi:transposase